MQYYVVSDELYHHGILGMKWGVRRYQNEDGSYTRAGMARYNKSMDRYTDAKAHLKSVRQRRKSGTATSRDVSVAKRATKEAKRKLNRDYDQLALDKKADRGRRLNSAGVSILSNTFQSRQKQAKIFVAGSLVSMGAIAFDDPALASIIEAGTVAAMAMVNAKTYKENSDIRAHYNHRRPKD